MKTKLYAALVACVAVAGLFTANSQAAIAEPGCGGGSILCAISPDGQRFYKGEEIELQEQ